MSYNTKVYTKQGGDEMVVASGGVVTVESGGKMNIAAGAQITADGTQAAHIANVATAGSATAAANATAINSILAALRGAGILASS